MNYLTDNPLVGGPASLSSWIRTLFGHGVELARSHLSEKESLNQGVDV
jgi:hypothetical protein